MVWAGATKHIWDNALEFEAYGRSNTALDVYMLQGGVPETVMLGGTSDISQFCKHGFYGWVMFRDDPIQYPDENPVLGIYLGPEIYVSPEMTSKIMKGNGEVLHRSTYCGLKEYEKSNKAHISSMKYFDNSVRYKLGPDISPEKIPDIS